MEGHYQLTIPAVRDLVEISSYLTEQASSETAERFLATLTRKFQLLADNPGAGRMRADIQPSVRSIPEGSYLVFYRVVDIGVQILRVVHGARDVSRLFPAEEE